MTALVIYHDSLNSVVFSFTNLKKSLSDPVILLVGIILIKITNSLHTLLLLPIITIELNI